MLFAMVWSSNLAAFVTQVLGLIFTVIGIKVIACFRPAHVSALDHLFRKDPLGGVGGHNGALA